MSRTPLEQMHYWWDKSIFDDDCLTIDEYARKVGERLVKMHGCEVPADATVEEIHALVLKHEPLLPTG